MKNLSLAIMALLALSCTQNKKVDNTPLENNEELIQIYKEDQADRKTQPIDWSVVSKRDSLREVRVYELLDSNLIRTSQDYHHAAMVFQHGGDSIAYGMAVKLMRKSIELDSTANKWLLAAAIDRHLLSKGEMQIYGTQYWKKGKDTPWELSDYDSTRISDAERRAYNVPSLAEQRERLKSMNSKKLSELLQANKSVEDIIAFIQKEDIAKSKYDLSESGINSFGYHLMRQEQKEEALKIFKLNTELYPNAFNTHDSYGECLLQLGQKEKAIAAYKKSLELNPNNKSAVKIVEENS